jgi:TrmH family RNA methyltransferase
MDTLRKISNAQFKNYQKLLLKKQRQAEGKFIIEGKHLVEDALRAEWDVDAILICSSSSSDDGLHTIKSDAKRLMIPIYEITEKELNTLADVVTSQGILAVAKMPDRTFESCFNNGSKSSIIVVLDAVADPGNAGTILRTCDWFGVDAVMLTEGSVDMFNPKVVRSTMGAFFHLPVCKDVHAGNLLRRAKEHGYTVVVTTLGEGSVLNNWHVPEKCLLVFGNETHGVSDEVLSTSDERITIPKFGKAESLNVAISCGVILSYMRVRR